MMEKEKWDALHNIFTGIACVIANGPSLNDIPVSFLTKYPSFGTNNIFLKDIVTTFYVVTNEHVIEQSRNAILDYPADVKFSKSLLPDFIHYDINNKRRFSKAPHEGLHEGHTVTHVCLQIAWWMGFTEILIVGLDHHYNDVGKSNETAVKTQPDTDHFSAAYFPPGTVWQYPDLCQSEISYTRALSVYKKSGRSIINISTKSACSIFPREAWEDYA